MASPLKPSYHSMLYLLRELRIKAAGVGQSQLNFLVWLQATLGDARG
jgi:hypothetical protein